jgi:hypothetical protein
MKRVVRRSAWLKKMAHGVSASSMPASQHTSRRMLAYASPAGDYQPNVPTGSLSRNAQVIKLAASVAPDAKALPRQSANHLPGPVRQVAPSGKSKTVRINPRLRLLSARSAATYSWEVKGQLRTSRALSVITVGSKTRPVPNSCAIIVIERLWLPSTDSCNTAARQCEPGSAGTGHERRQSAGSGGDTCQVAPG